MANTQTKKIKLGNEILNAFNESMSPEEKMYDHQVLGKVLDIKLSGDENMSITQSGSLYAFWETNLKGRTKSGTVEMAEDLIVLFAERIHKIFPPIVEGQMRAILGLD